MNKVRLISIGGILTTITVLFQSAPVFSPAVGLLFSPLSTLPVAIAAFYHIPLGLTVLISSALILTLVSIQEAIILLLTTGLLGIVIGTFLYRKGMLISILFSTIILFLGMVSLTYIVGISAFGDLTSSASIPLTLFIFTVFSLIYTSIWNIYIRKFINYPDQRKNNKYRLKYTFPSNILPSYSACNRLIYSLGDFYRLSLSQGVLVMKQHPPSHYYFYVFLYQPARTQHPAHFTYLS